MSFHPFETQRVNKLKAKLVKQGNLDSEEIHWLISGLLDSNIMLNKVASAMGIKINELRRKDKPPILPRWSSPCVDKRHEDLPTESINKLFTPKLTIRTRNCLQNFLDDKNLDPAALSIRVFVRLSRFELLKTRNFGAKSLGEVEDQITDYGIGLCHYCRNPIAQKNSADEPFQFCRFSF